MSGVVNNVIRRFKSYIRVFGAIGLTAALVSAIPFELPNYAIIGLLIVAWLVVSMGLELLIASVAATVGGSDGDQTEAETEPATEFDFE